MMTFEWDEKKNHENILKHGVSFKEAQETQIFASLVQDIGEGREKYMKKKIIYTDPPPEIAESLARAVTIENFLPPPSELVRKVSSQEGIKTSSIRKKRVEYA